MNAVKSNTEISIAVVIRAFFKVTLLDTYSARVKRVEYKRRISHVCSIIAV